MRMRIEFWKFTPEWELRIAILFKFRCEWELEWELPIFLDQLLISGQNTPLKNTLSKVKLLHNNQLVTSC